MNVDLSTSYLDLYPSLNEKPMFTSVCKVVSVSDVTSLLTVRVPKSNLKSCLMDKVK